jgi:hypothetical protein
MTGKTFIGTWVDTKIKKKFAIACITHEVNQQDVHELLITKWLKESHIDNEIKELVNGRKKK